RYTEMELTPPPPVPLAPSAAQAPMTTTPSAQPQPPVIAAPSAPVQEAPLPRAAEPPAAEISKPSSGVAPATEAPPMPAGPPPQAELPVPETAGRTRETSRSVQRPPAGADRGHVAAPTPEKMAALPPSTAKAPVPVGTQVGTVLFADNSSKVSESYDKLLKDIVSMTKEKGGILHVVGHASPGAQGGDALKQRVANFRVSLARANAVARELVRLGVPARDVMVEGRADNEPLYPESAPGGDAGNRRAEIYIDYPKGRR
ncbi:MAG: OmpA family protein, partial [Alphaproteobacteria bacterium]